MSEFDHAVEMDVVLYPEGNVWIAQGLQFDVTARGESPAQASDRFDLKIGVELLMSLELDDEAPLSDVGRAPEKFWRMFKTAKMTFEKEPTPIRITDGSRTAKVHARMKISDQEAS